MITPNGIRYTWGQIFDRLGIRAEENHFSIGTQTIIFHYEDSEETQSDPGVFHLVISKGEPTNLDQICDDPNLAITRLSKIDLLPDQKDDLPVDELPVLFWGSSAKKNRFARINNGKTLIIEADLIQCIFFLLSRYEEFHLKAKDSHGRFPYTASAASRFGFIENPLVDLYVLILKKWLEALTGNPIPQKEKFEIALSHDVDFLSPFQPLTNWLKTTTKDFLRMNGKNLINDLNNLRPNASQDPYIQGISRLAETSTRYDLKSIFYLMATSRSNWDEGYSLDSKPFRQAVQIIKDNGHAIGLHASYLSYSHPEIILEEKLQLEKAVGDKVNFVRQHYLRVRTPQSWEGWNTAGFTRDSSYTFPEHEGFRCGTCHPFKVFDLNQDRELSLVEEPLIAMDTTLKTYRKLSIEEGKKKIIQLGKICKIMNGKFTLLWHNTSFFRDWQLWGEHYPKFIGELLDI